MIIEFSMTVSFGTCRRLLDCDSVTHALFPKLPASTTMPPHRTPTHYIRSFDTGGNLPQLALAYRGSFAHHEIRHQPYYVRIPPNRQPDISISIPPELLEKVNLAENAATSKTTKRKDASRLREYLLFCEGLGIDAQKALPAPEDLLIAWASSYARRVAGKTVGAKLTAIRKEHQKRGLPWYGGERLRRIVKGIEELRPASSFRPKRAPVTIDMLMDLNSGLSRTSGLDICVRAVCLLSFFCQLRCGEILPPSHDLSKFNHHLHATFAHISESTAESGASNLHLPWSKTQKARGDDVWIPRQEAPLDPIHALHKHFIKNRLELGHPIAAYRNEHGKVVTLTRSRFIRRINQILRNSNKRHPRITGHCFRIGGTTFYLVSGVPPDMVKKFGRWRSHAFLEYWRCLDCLGALHIENLPLKIQRHGGEMRSHPKA